MNVAAVILARGGSKRLPGKNVRLLRDKPLIAYTVAAAAGAATLSRAIVSTDDPAIAEAARAAGAEVPFLRPPELATDTSHPAEALLHALDWLDRNGPRPDALVLLQATSPLRRAEHVDGAVELFRRTGADTVTAVIAAPVHPFWCWRRDGDMLMPFFSLEQMSMGRHELPPAFVETGAVYVFRRECLTPAGFYGERVAGYPMERRDSIDIDTIEDFRMAEILLSTAPELSAAPEPGGRDA